MFAGRVVQGMIIHIVGVETPGLWVGWVDGGETCGVGMHRAVQLEKVLGGTRLAQARFPSCARHPRTCGWRSNRRRFVRRTGSERPSPSRSLLRNARP